MALVDLRGRVGEPAVLELVALAGGGEAALARYRAREWALVGWEEDGAPVACAGLERGGADEVLLRGLAVTPERRGEGIGRRLLDSLADVAVARRIVAAADSGFLRACGFESAGGGRLVREIVPRAGARDATGAVTLDALERAIRGAWDAATYDDPGEFSPDNPARGHCAVTALVVRDLLGGEILVANVLRDGARVDRHAWNRLPSGLAVDLTRDQFRNGETFEQPVVEEPLLASRDRYELLAARVRDALRLPR